MVKIFALRHRLFFLVQLAIIIGLFSCRANKPVVSNSGVQLSNEGYINTYKDLAISEMNRTGIPASITLAQGMIESDNGHSTLAVEANNHFGIKCHNDWTGPSVRHDDDRRNECFRKYSKAEESFHDHSDFLKSASRYSFLFNIGHTDYKAWAHGLKKAGYATNPDYANMLIRTIEENSLWNLDQGYKSQPQSAKVIIPEKAYVGVHDSVDKMKPVQIVSGNTLVVSRVQRVMENNRIQYIMVRDGDTREKLEKEFELLKWELPRYNDLENNFTPNAGQILYLQPKKDKAEAGKEYHEAVAGETMYQISQHYGIKLKSLYEMNRMLSGTEPGAGKKIWLRSVKPVN